jgi:hypothetical protein
MPQVEHVDNSADLLIENLSASLSDVPDRWSRRVSATIRMFKATRLGHAD